MSEIDINEIVDYEEMEYEQEKTKENTNKLIINCLTVVDQTNMGGIDEFGKQGFLEITNSTDSETTISMEIGEKDDEDEDDFHEFDITEEHEEEEEKNRLALNPVFQNKADEEPISYDEIETEVYDIFGNFDSFDPQRQFESEFQTKDVSIENLKEKGKTKSLSPQRNVANMKLDINSNGTVISGFIKNKKVTYDEKKILDPFFPFTGFDIPYYEFPHFDFFTILSILRYINPFNIENDLNVDKIISKRIDILSDFCMSIFSPNPSSQEDFNPKMRYMFNAIYNIDSMSIDNFLVNGYSLFYRQLEDDTTRKTFYEKIKRDLMGRDDLYEDFLTDQSVVNAVFRLLIIKRCFMIVYDSNKDIGLENLSSLCFDYQFTHKKTRSEGKRKEFFITHIGNKITELVEELNQNRNKFNEAIIEFINQAINGSVFDINVKNFFLKCYGDSFGNHKLNVDLFNDRLSLSRSLFDKTICNSFDIMRDVNKKSTFFSMINKKVVEEQKIHVYMKIQSELLKSSTNLIFSEFSEMVFNASINNLTNSLIEYSDEEEEIQSYLDEYWLSLLSKTLFKIAETIKTNIHNTSSFFYLLKNINFYLNYIKIYTEHKKNK